MGLFGYLPMPRKTGQCWVNVANGPRVDSSKSREMRYMETNVEAADLDSDIDFSSGSSPKISTWRFIPPLGRNAPGSAAGQRLANLP